MSLFFDGSYGDVDLYISSLSSTGGRDLAIQSPSRGDRHLVQDRGLSTRRSRLELLFVSMPGERANYFERFQRFAAFANGEAAQIFQHPIDGSYLAKVESFSYEVDAESESIRASASFIALENTEFVFAAGNGADGSAGVESVTVAALTANDAITAAGLIDPFSTTVAAETADAVTAWSVSDRLDPAQVLLEVNTLSRKIDSAIAATNYATSYEKWDAFKALTGLRFQLGRAAEVFTANTARVFDLFVDGPQPLLAICAQVYGAAQAEQMAGEVARGNRIRTPGLVPAGTTLKMPAPEVSR